MWGEARKKSKTAQVVKRKKKYNKSLHQIINTVDAFYVFLVFASKQVLFFFKHAEIFLFSHRSETIIRKMNVTHTDISHWLQKKNP